MLCFKTQKNIFYDLSDRDNYEKEKCLKPSVINVLLKANLSRDDNK